MKKLFALLLCTIMLFNAGVCFAESYDLENMTGAELRSLQRMISAELDSNHSPSSSEKTKVEKAYKASVEDYYGKNNVEWPWIDYTYAKDWDYFTIDTYARIKKSDGGSARYDLLGAVNYDGQTYQTVFIQVGTEIILDEREDVITDIRIRKMLGYVDDAEMPQGIDEAIVDTAEAAVSNEAVKEVETDATTKPFDLSQPIKKDTEKSTSDDNNAAKVTPTPSPERNYQNGDKGDEVKKIQQRLITLGYLDGSADGSFGKKTEEAVKKFQQASNLSATGIVDTMTYTALFMSNAPAAPTPTPAPLSFTASALYDKYQTNEVAANNELKGKRISVSGKIHSIEEDSGLFSSGYVVELYADSYGFELIYCYFDKNQANAISKLKKDSKVVISGICDGTTIFSDVKLKDCEVVG